MKKTLLLAAMVCCFIFGNNAVYAQNDLISYAIDSSPYKQNLFLPGSHIEVKDKEFLKDHIPDYIWIPAWNIKDEIIKEVESTLKPVVSAMGGGCYANLY